MITKEEILDHLAHTLYSSGARKSIIGYLVGIGMCTDNIEFAKRNCSARDKSAKTFEDFVTFVREKDLENQALDALKEATERRDNLKFGLSSFRDMCEHTAKELSEALDSFMENINPDKAVAQDFQIGDWVKYIPAPDESYTEYVEAIAYDSNGNMYLCLSNGEYVSPHYCVKYKVQGEERYKLIDKLNEVV